MLVLVHLKGIENLFNPRTNGGRDYESDVALTLKSVDNELICQYWKYMDETKLCCKDQKQFFCTIVQFFADKDMYCMHTTPLL